MSAWKTDLTEPNRTLTRIGSLFLNYGGPGASGIAAIRDFADRGSNVPQSIFESFDLIGLDPRGVGLSNGISCNNKIHAENVAYAPQNEEEFNKMVDKNRRYAESCRELTGPLFEHLDTISVAKDFEAVRVALNDGPMNFLGMSYGTMIGAQYAALFPDNIRTLALDSVLLHSPNETMMLLDEATSIGLASKAYFEWASTSEVSELRGQDVEAMYNAVLANATEKPIPVPDCPDNNECTTFVTAPNIASSIRGYLGFPMLKPGQIGGSYAALSRAFINATEGNGSGFIRSNGPDAFLAIGCLDWVHSATSVSDLLAKQALLKQYAPISGTAPGMWDLQTKCIGWPYKVKNPPKKLHIKTDATILVTNGINDAATPMVWAQGLMEQLENAVFVTRKAGGHIGFNKGGATTELIADYLVSSIAPEAGITLDN